MEATNLNDGDYCVVIKGTHIGKFGKVSDINTSKTGHITLLLNRTTQLGLKPWAGM